MPIVDLYSLTAVIHETHGIYACAADAQLFDREVYLGAAWLLQNPWLWETRTCVLRDLDASCTVPLCNMPACVPKYSSAHVVVEF